MKSGPIVPKAQVWAPMPGGLLARVSNSSGEGWEANGKVGMRYEPRADVQAAQAALFSHFPSTVGF